MVPVPETPRLRKFKASNGQDRATDQSMILKNIQRYYERIALKQQAEARSGAVAAIEPR
jgi:hypothetical protein